MSRFLNRASKASFECFPQLLKGRFVYRYGGDPVGAFHRKCTRPAPWAVAHALLFDQTHDNPSPVQVRGWVRVRAI